MADSASNEFIAKSESVELEGEAQIVRPVARSRSGRPSVADLLNANNERIENDVLLNEGMRFRGQKPASKPLMTADAAARQASEFFASGTMMQQQLLSNELRKKIRDRFGSWGDRLPSELTARGIDLIEATIGESLSAAECNLEVIRRLIEDMKRYCIDELLLLLSQYKGTDIETFGEAIIDIVGALHSEDENYRKYKGSFVREWRESVRSLKLIAGEENQIEAVSTVEQNSFQKETEASSLKAGRKGATPKRARKLKKRRQRELQVAVAPFRFEYAVSHYPVSASRVATMLQPYHLQATRDAEKQPVKKERVTFNFDHDIQTRLGFLEEPQLNPRVLTDASGLRKFVDSLSITELKLLDEIELVKVS